MRKPSPFVLFAAVVSTSIACCAQRCPISIQGVEPRATLGTQPPDPHPPYLAISWENQSGEPISRVLFEVHFPNGLGEFMTYRQTHANAIDTSVWSDAAFVAAYGATLHLHVRAEKIVFANGTTWLDDGSHVCAGTFGESQPGFSGTAAPAPAPQKLGDVPRFSSSASLPSMSPRSERACLISYVTVDPDGSGSTLFLRVVYRNDSWRTIAGVLFASRAKDGTLATFPSGRAVAPGKESQEIWNYREGEARPSAIWPETIYYDDGTEWQDKRRACASSNPASWRGGIDRQVAAAPPEPTVSPVPQVTPGASLFVAPDSKAAVPSGEAESLVSPTQEAVIEATEKLNGILDRARAVATALPVPIGRSELLATLPELQSPPLPEFPIHLACPVTAVYLDIGGQGRIYAGLHNWSNISVSSILLDVTDDSTDKVYTFRDDQPLVSGGLYDGTWYTGSKSASPRTIEIREVDFADGQHWTEPAGTVCAVSTRNLSQPVPAENVHPTDAVLHLYATTTSVAAFHAELATSIDRPTAAVPAAPPRVRTPHPMAASVASSPRPSVVTGHQEPSVASGPGGVTAAEEPVIEEATPAAFRRDAPLVSRGKASICTVTSVPSGAEVTLDGKVLGTTPLVFVMIRKPDARNLLISSPGYVSVQYQLYPDGQPVPMTVLLQKVGEDGSVPVVTQATGSATTTQ